jgi:uncharacterized protein (TIGR03083 family)
MSRLHGTKDFWLAGLRADAAAFDTAAVEAPPDAAVPSCPDWTATHLVNHLGSVYAWTRQLLVRGGTDRPEQRREPDGPADHGAAVAQWREAYAGLLSTLEATDPEAPLWNWAPQSKTAGFWHRRMAHETAVHRWDLQMAMAAVEPVEAKLAADGVTEVLDSWLPAGRRRSTDRPTGVVHLVATDASQEWLVRLRGEGVALLDTDTVFDNDEPHARVEAVGAASDLLLALYGRVGFDVLELAGDAALLEGLRTG